MRPRAGCDRARWDGATFPRFQISGEGILGDLPDDSRRMRTLQSFGGDHDLRREAGVIEEMAGGDAMLALLGCYKGDDDFVGAGILNRQVYFFDRTCARDKRILQKTPISSWTHPCDPAERSPHELRFREDEITALIDGQVLGSEERTDHRYEGNAGPYGQWIRVAFRKVELQRR